TANGLCNGSRGVVVGYVRDETEEGKKFVSATHGANVKELTTCDLVKGWEANEVLWPVVRFLRPHADSLTMTVYPAAWDITEGPAIVATRWQVPLALAWAITIHKSQGMSL